MRILSDTKTKAKILLGLSFFLSLNFYFARLTSADSSTSTSATDLTNQETALQNQLGGINSQIKNYQSQISTVEVRADTLKNEITILDDEAASTQLALQAKQTQIEDTNLQLTETRMLIAQKQLDINQNQEVLGELIVQLNDYDNQYALQTTLGSNNLSDFLDQIQYTSSYSDKINQLTDKIKTLKTQLQTQQTNLQAQLTNLQTLQNELQITQESLTEQTSQKQTLLQQTRGIESNYQKLLASSQASAADLQKEVNDLDNKIRAQLGNKTLPPSQGILAWPVDGVVTQGYGNTGFTALGYTFHNGIDVAGPAGAPVYAAADGVIFDTDQSDAEFGNWVAIKHSLTGTNGPVNIVTLYGHLRSFIVKPGQAVKQGDLIGYEGNTGNTTAKLYGPERGYHVHFGVYDADGFGVAEGAYTKIYGPYKIPYGYTYNPLDFLGK